MAPAQPNKSLKNGLACLQALAALDRPAGSRELSRLLGIEHTKVNRHLGTLTELGLAARTRDRKYMPGPAIHVLAAQALKGSGLLAAALPHIRPLMDERLAVALGILWQGRVCYVVFARPGEPVEQGIGSQALYPAAISTVGRPILAAGAGSLLDEALQAAAMDGHPFTRRELKAELALVRKQGYALRTEAGVINSISVAVGTPPVAGLAFSGTIAPNAVSHLVARLAEAAGRIARLSARK